MNVHDDVKELLKELNEIGQAVIFGGYLRDLSMGFIPSDVDIATNVSIEKIEEKYGHYEKAGRRISANGHEIFSFKMERTEKIFIEIICTNEPLIDKANKADYTINSLLFDGQHFIDSQNWRRDINEKKIRAVNTEIIGQDLKNRPYLWLKTIRLVSMFGFDLSEEVQELLNKNKTYINNISKEIMQTEGHKTLNGKGLIRAIRCLSSLGFISNFDSFEYWEDKFNIQLMPHQKLVLLSLLTNEKVCYEYMNFYHFSDTLRDKYQELYDAYKSKEKSANRLKHQVISIKKIIEGGSK